MCNLYDDIKRIFENQQLWDYYIDKRQDEIEFPLTNKDEALHFINYYFHTGGKEVVFDTHKIFSGDSEIINDRSMHIVSTFFIGIIISDLFPDIKKEKLFLYRWFLTCLFHDYGYIIENNKEKYPPKIYNMSKIRKELSITKRFPYQKYDRDTINKYFKYIKKSRLRLDHGIIGGLLLYDRLVKNFEANFKKAKKVKTDISEMGFEYLGLQWSKNDFKLYAQSADSIVAHNIWLANKEKDKTSYREFGGIDKLIINNHTDKLSMNDAFILLLAIADTIEPIKFFSQHKEKCILQKIKISISENKIKIKILDECINYTNWFEKINDLKNWMNVSVYLESNEITISIID